VETIYLDHNATTPIHPEVVEAMARAWRDGHANPASQHQAGQKARRVLEDAREEIAALLGADVTGPRPDRVIFTSGGTEANNLAVLGIAHASLRQGPTAHELGASREGPLSTSALRPAPSPSSIPTSAPGPAPSAPPQVIVSAIEHPSVLEPAQHLLDEGWRVDTLAVDTDGVARVELLEDLLGPQTRLVSVMLGNHETGVLQPVPRIAEICTRVGVPLHTDAVQAVGKLPVRFRELGVAAMSIGAHKFRGPLGIGALVARDGVALEPLLFGGHQQWGLRPGTEPVALVVGMLAALRIATRDQAAHLERLTSLRDRLEAGLRTGMPDLVVNGAAAPRLPHTSSIAFPGLDGQILLLALDMAGVACSVGSACSSGSSELSPTLRAMGLPKEVLAGSLRFSLGTTTTVQEIDEAVRRILMVVNQLR